MSTNNNNLLQGINGAAFVTSNPKQSLFFAIAFAAFFVMMFHPYWLKRQKLAARSIGSGVLAAPFVSLLSILDRFHLNIVEKP